MQWLCAAFCAWAGPFLTVGRKYTVFLYDVIKITILLCLLIFIISYIQSYFPPERSKKNSRTFSRARSEFHSSSFGNGDATFCSCSSIPLFIGFTSAACRWAWHFPSWFPPLWWISEASCFWWAFSAWKSLLYTWSSDWLWRLSEARSSRSCTWNAM